MVLGGGGKAECYRRARMRGFKPSGGGWMEKGGRGKVGCGGVSEAAGWVNTSN